MAVREAAARRRRQLSVSWAVGVETRRRWRRCWQRVGVGSSAATARLQQAALQQRLQRGIGGGSAVAASVERQRQRGRGAVTASSAAVVSAARG
jgi:hypothetical protein